MTKKGKQKRKDLQALGIVPDRGATFIGCRSTVFSSQKHNRKESRRQGRVKAYEWN